jgi:hypothetical protein
MKKAKQNAWVPKVTKVKFGKTLEKRAETAYITYIPIAFGLHVTVSFYGENNVSVIATGGNALNPVKVIVQRADDPVTVKEIPFEETEQIQQAICSAMPKSLAERPEIKRIW